MKYLVLFFFLFILMLNPEGQGEVIIHSEGFNNTSSVYPVPPHNDRSLFYIQRSKNTNAIVYESNILPDGSLNPLDPVRIFWIRYASDSLTDELTYVQRKFAYGIEAAPIKGFPGQYVLNFVSYPKKKIYLSKDSDNRHYRAYTSINGKLAELKKIFITINGGSFWFPKIEDIELAGKDPGSQKSVSEHFKP